MTATDTAGQSASDEFALLIRNHIRGTPGQDTLTGQNGRENLIVGLGGDDAILGGDRNDELAGGPGDDTLRGRPGDDELNGGAGDDLLVGGAGDDLLDGGAGGDTLRGAKGDDLLIGGAGNDILVAGRGDDVPIGGPGGDRLQGGQGADVFRFLSVADSLPGSGQNDRILDFSFAEGDRIDLSAIDADGVGANGDTAFVWVGAFGTGAAPPFSGARGELLALQTAGGAWRILVDVDGSMWTATHPPISPCGSARRRRRRRRGSCSDARCRCSAAKAAIGSDTR